METMKTKSTDEIRNLIDRINEKKPMLQGEIRATDPVGAKADAEKTYTLSFSSEEPYQRWWGIEVLGHKAGEVDMDWIASGHAPLLLQHDHDKQIGVIESAKIEGGRGTAVVRFGRSALAQEIKQDVDDGIRSNVSVGYQIQDMKLVESKNDINTYRVTRWMPFENSIVSIPADQTVGVGRSGEHPKPTIETKENIMEKEKMEALAKSLGLNKDASLESILEAKERQAREQASNDMNAELKRQTDIRAEADAHKDRIKDIDERCRVAIRDKISLQSFRGEILDCYTNGIAQLRSAPETLSKQEKRDMSKYSFCKAIVERADNGLSGLELELHQEAQREAKANGLPAIAGFGIPYSVIASRDLTVATEGADLVATGITGFIELLRNKMLLQSLGARMLTGLSGNVQIPKATAGGAAAWEGENDANAESTQTIGQVAFTPHRVGHFTDISKLLLLQSTPDIEAFVRDDLATAIALAIDYGGIAGTGSGNQPTGIINTSGIGSVAGGTNGLAPAWSHIVDLETAVAVDNADVGALSYLTNAVVRGKLKQTAKVASTDSMMIWGSGDMPLNGYGCGVSNQVPSDLDKGTSTGVCSAILFGNFNDLIIAQYGGLDVVVDPYTQATSNLLRIVMNTYADIGVRHAESFAAMLDALTA